MPWGHCRMLYACSYRGRRVAYVKRKYMLLLKDVRRLLTNMETTLKNNCAISNTVINLRGISTCETCRYQAVKNRRHCFLINVCIMHFVSVTFLRPGLTNM
jgi:hypothetical protein